MYIIKYKGALQFVIKVKTLHIKDMVIKESFVVKRIFVNLT